MKRYKDTWSILWDAISHLFRCKDRNWIKFLQACSSFVSTGLAIGSISMYLSGGGSRSAMFWGEVISAGSVLFLIVSALIYSKDDFKAFGLATVAKIREALNNFRILLLLWLIIRALTSRPKIKQAPGTKLLSFVEFFYSPKTVEEVFKPVIADWRTEYFDALKQKRTIKAHWISVRYKYHFVVAMGVSKVYSLFRSILSARK
jgi:hypothetical protein